MVFPMKESMTSQPSGEMLPQDPVLGLLAKAHDRGGALVRPEDMAKVKGRAVAAMEEQVNAQLRQIYKQAETLMEQARDLQSRADISYRIYKAAIGFDPGIGSIYYLYEGEAGKRDWLSMISPSEFAGKYTHLATVKLLHDHTWEILENLTNNADPTDRVVDVPEYHANSTGSVAQAKGTGGENHNPAVDI